MTFEISEIGKGGVTHGTLVVMKRPFSFQMFLDFGEMKGAVPAVNTLVLQRTAWHCVMLEHVELKQVLLFQGIHLGTMAAFEMIFMVPDHVVLKVVFSGKLLVTLVTAEFFLFLLKLVRGLTF